MNIENKTEFPDAWDEEMTTKAIINAMDSTDPEPFRDGELIHRFDDGSIRLIVRTDLDGQLITAYPYDGTGVRRNGKKDGAVQKDLPHARRRSRSDRGGLVLRRAALGDLGRGMQCRGTAP